MRKIAAAVLATLIALIAFDLYPRTMPVYGQVYPQPPNVGLLAARPTFCANTGQTYYATDNTTLYYSTVPGTNCTWVSVGGSGGGTVLANATLGGAPSSLYTFFPAPSAACNSYSLTGTTFCAVNNSTGVVDFSGTDMAVVLNSVLTANATAGGRLYFKRGVYSVNSLIEDATAGCASFQGSGNKLAYAFGIPANTGYATGVQWIFEGESTSVWTGEEGATTINANGVVFNVTSTAVSSVTANDVLTGFWQRPITNCTFSSANLSNDLIFKNITLRFPTNTRGNEIAFASWFAGDVQYSNVVADFNLPYNSIATGSAPVAGSFGSIGFTSSISQAGDWQHFDQTYATGWNVCYDLEEHITGTSLTSIYCNYAGQVGLYGPTVYHAGTITKFNDQENLHGLVFGTGMVQGSHFDIFEYDIELGTANWYARTTPGFSETNPGYTSGVVYWSMSSQNTGFATNQTATLFSSGGNNFQSFAGQGAPNIALAPAADTFTRQNTSPTAGTNGLGPAWENGTQSLPNSNLKIVSNSARLASAGGTGTGFSLYLAQPFNADQFSKMTCSILVAAANYCEALVRGSSNPAVQTYYAYYSGGTAGAGRGILKQVAGSATVLASQTSAAGAAGDVLELDVVGTTLWAYRNGALDTSFTNPVTDSSITSGNPGILAVAAGANGAAITNFQGGSFPTKTGTDSVYGNPTYAPMRLSTGVPPTPTGTGACATITTQVPASTSAGSQAGSLKCTGTTGASTITLTFPAAQTAPNGWRCSADDETTVADRPNQTSYTVTTCVLTTAATASNDVIVWNASPF